MIATINPATGDCLATFDPLTESQLDEKLARAAEAFRTYRHTTFAERAAWMRRAAEILETEKDAFARIDRKSTRLNSSHANISYAVFCLKKNDAVGADGA